jgi:hypothetical protein
MFSNAVNGFRKEWTKLSLTADLDVRRHQHRMMSIRWELWYGMIGILLLEWLQREWISIERLCDSFWQIWGWGHFVRRRCPRTWSTISCRREVSNQGECRKTEQSHYCGWKLGFSVGPWDKSAEHAVEFSRLHTNPVKRGCQFENRRQCRFVPWLQRDNAPRVCLAWLDYQLEAVSPSFGASETAGSSRKARIVPCTMTTHPRKQRVPSSSFPQKNWPWSWNIPLTYRILLRVTSSSSLPWRIVSKDHILEPWKRFRRLRRPL